MAGDGIAGLAGRALADAARAVGRASRSQVVKRVGGPARARVVVLFGAVLALNSADSATIGATAPQLEKALHIGNTDIGLLSSVALLVGAVFVIPVGLLVDRVRRMPLLAVSIVLWSLASLFSAFAGSYSTLLLSRLALGAVTATAGPAIASLTGDYFPANERSRIYAYILGGEIAGTAVGFIVSGTVASAISWRVAFLLLAIPGFFLAWTVWITVPEPLRGGQSHLEPGTLDLDEALAHAGEHPPDEAAGQDELHRVEDLAQEAVRERGIQPDPKLVLRRDARQLPLIASVRYILSIPTNVLLIVSSALGYFFLSGLSTFGLLFVRGHFRVSQITAELALALLVGAALVGTLLSGWISDRLLRRGVYEARISVPAICYVGAAVLFLIGFLGSHLGSALVFVLPGAALLYATNPPLDAARLDIMPSGLWGRAESTRTFLRSIAQALAPLVFGGVADLVAGIVPKQTPVGTHTHGAISSSAATGLQVSFLIMLVTLAAAGVALWRARVTYPRDVATAAASEDA